MRRQEYKDAEHKGEEKGGSAVQNQGGGQLPIVHIVGKDEQERKLSRTHPGHVWQGADDHVHQSPQ